jgi:hypothetical protein
MITGPFRAAFFARPRSWFTSRLEKVVMDIGRLRTDSTMLM